MPIYEYRCTACGHGFELRQGFNDPAGAPCPQCHSVSQRIIQPVGIVFKGSGWHINDYRRASSAAPSEPGGKAEAGGSGGDSAESKPKEPAAAAPAKPAKASPSSPSSSSE